MQKQHDIHSFLISAQQALRDEYERILQRAAEDPGTAGDQGEENWATLLRNWLPSYFHIVTKGRILCENGYASPQIDVLVLHASYPRVLLDKKLYLAGGVAAAFECKITLKSSHVRDTVETAAMIRRNLPKREGSPYRELNSTIIFGLLSQSHSWKGKGSKPVENIESSLWDADKSHVTHPIEMPDFITVSDLGTWQAMKCAYMSPARPHYNDALRRVYGDQGSATSSYVCAAIGTEQQQDYFTPIGVLLAGLFSRLSWTFKDMRGLDAYFRKVNMMGSGKGHARLWPITIYSERIRTRVYNGILSNGVPYDEWHCAF